MKKILAILLSLALVICMLPASAVTAWAGGPASPVTLTDDMITLSPASGTYTGATIATPTVTVKGATAADFEVQCDSIKDAGDYTIKVSAKTGSTVLSGSATATFTVAPRDLGTAGVSIAEKAGAHLAASDLNDASKINATEYFVVEYNGTNITDDCTLTVEKGGTTSAPAAVVTATAKTGNVTKMITRSFTIKTDLSGATVKQSGTLTYNGKAQKPSFTVTLKSADGKTTTTLKQDTDFEVVDYTATEATTSTATIRGIGSYYGEIKNVEYTIGAKSLSSSNTTITIPNITIGGKFSITVRDKDLDKELNGSDYYLSPETPSDFQKAGTYNITINGTGNYKGSISTTYRVVKEDNLIKSDDVTCKDRNVLYTGSKQEISTTVVVGNTTLRKGTDYTIAYYDIYADDKDKDKAVDPKNVSTYSVYLQGKGDYAVNSSDSKGLWIASFTIQPISLDRITVNFSSSTKYDSSSRAYVPKVSLKASNGAVIPTTDYDVKYYGFNSSYKTQYVVVTLVEKGKKGIDQTEASTGSLAETSRGKDSIEEDYKGATIDQNNSKNIDVTYDKAYYWKDEKASKTENNKQKVTIKSGDVIDYIGEKVYLDLSVYDRDSRRYLESYEYTVTYKNSAKRTVSYLYDADTYTITVESTSSYENKYKRSFKVDKTLKISGNDISGYTVTLDKTSVNATGTAITLPKVTSVAKGSTKLSTSEYTVSYKDSADKTVTRIIAPGTYKVVVTGAGKYSGTTSATFRVIGLSQTITGVESSYKLYPNTQNSSTLQLAPKATEGTFTYTSSDSSIASVSSTGLVTAYKAGRAKITITTTGNTKYDPTTFSTVIKVYPKKAVMTRKPWNTAKKGQVKVRWNKQDNVTRYEIRYSRAKNFAKGTYITKKVNAAQNDYTTQSTTLKNLKRGAKYYVKVRAVKEVYNDNGKMLTYYGSWSGWKSVVVK